MDWERAAAATGFALFLLAAWVSVMPPVRRAVRFALLAVSIVFYGLNWYAERELSDRTAADREKLQKDAAAARDNAAAARDNAAVAGEDAAVARARLVGVQEDLAAARQMLLGAEKAHATAARAAERSHATTVGALREAHNATMRELDEAGRERTRLWAALSRACPGGVHTDDRGHIAEVPCRLAASIDAPASVRADLSVSTPPNGK